ncbi:MAG TPA: CDGSH iron-sulfur domain-containing protein, partial [Polyangia bacterium]|nr:CDGSH iron-sulfur domain-containing protein [Polyangia bacterium]
MSDVEEVNGQRVAIHFEGRKCIHSRHCVLSRPDVFVPNVEGEWIHPDRATPEEIAELAHACPSGAIRYRRLDGGPEESPPLVNVARVRENGPLAIAAQMTIDGHGDALRVTLCRCGASKNKPFCDGSHATVGFTATGEPPIVESRPLESRAGVLKVVPQRDGPLRLEGNLELCSGTGHTINRVGKTALCR